MKIFNIGFPELILVLIIMLIFVGPGGMQESVRKLARLIRHVVRSETWRTFTSFFNEVKEFPAQVMKEVELEELGKDLKNELIEINQSVGTGITAAQSEMNDVLQSQEAELKQFDNVPNQINTELANINLAETNSGEMKNNE